MAGGERTRRCPDKWDGKTAGRVIATLRARSGAKALR
jgi:hypothetical protein